METTKKKRGGERLKIEAGGSGGIILIGGALVAAAFGAAFAARRARGSARGNRECDAIDKNKEEEKGLRGLLPSIEQQLKGEAVSVDCLVQENTSEKSEIGETTEGKESEGPGASHAESIADQVAWLEEVIEQWEDSASIEVNLLNQASEMTESLEDKVHVVQTEDSGNINHREEEFAFDSSVEIQETGEIQGSYKITEMITEIKESEIEASNTGGIDGDVTGEEFSFWNGKPSTPEIHTEQNLIELVTNDVPGEKEKESCIGEDGEKREQGSQEASSAELSEDAACPAMAIEQELEISEKTEDICVSEGGENTRMLQDHVPSTNCIEQEEGQVSVCSSEEAQEKACDDFKMVAEILDIPHVEGEDEEEGSSMKSQEEIELQLEDVGERGGEESEGLRNSSVEFSDQAVWPEDRIEQEKVDDSMSVFEVKHQPEIPRNIIEEVDVSICRTNYDNKLAQESISETVEINMPHNETSENLHESEVDHVEVDIEADDEQEGSSAKSLEEEKMLPVEGESEGEESIEIGNFSVELEKCSMPMYEMKQMLEIPEKIDEMVDEAHIEGTENSTRGIQSFLLSDDKHKEVSADSSVEAQEKVYMNLDTETEIDLKHDVVETHSYTDVAFNSSQGQNQQDREESQISHVEEEEEQEGVEDPSVGSQEEEKELPSIENEMKRKSEIPKKTTDFRQAEQDKEEHEQEVSKKESETIFTYKRTDFVLIGSSKLFLLVLITLAVGLLAFAHHDHLHNCNLRLPKIYRQLYQLFFPSYNRALGEL